MESTQNLNNSGKKSLNKSGMNSEREKDTRGLWGDLVEATGGRIGWTGGPHRWSGGICRATASDGVVREK